ncbi:hypothetical protein SCHPADRAFT_905879 [Schizopora paradoxa]|uniref:Uncharacterized protein n=1 Tax=Schizopora paradoxa TaxID=27342 RepID=A0A0H2RQ74_9AGAM|nr:hypothetical protein SCHPADRAFT_905879 [Schizopora paradoxa]
MSKIVSLAFRCPDDPTIPTHWEYVEWDTVLHNIKISGAAGYVHHLQCMYVYQLDVCVSFEDRRATLRKWYTKIYTVHFMLLQAVSASLLKSNTQVTADEATRASIKLEAFLEEIRNEMVYSNAMYPILDEASWNRQNVWRP